MKRLTIDPTTALAAIRGNLVDLETENIAALAARAADKPDLIALWYGEGDLVTPEYIRQAAKDALDQGQTFYVPQMAGAPALTAALAAYQSDLHGVPLSEDRSTITPGGMQAVHLAFSLILQAGDNAVYVEPQWPNIRHAIQVAGAEPRAVSLDLVEGEWRLDLDKLFDACDARTKAIVFSSPSNPCGWVADPETYRALIAFSRKTGIWIISDEVYSRLMAEGRAAPSLLQVAEPEDLAMCINGFSKAWAMTGWRIGWLNHPASVAPVVRAMTQYMNSGTAAMIQAGALAALTRGEDTVTMVRDRLSAGMDAAYSVLGRANSVVLPERPRGGMYTFFRIEGEDDADRSCLRMVEEASVGLAPGGLFGREFRGWIRMCIARDPKEIASACERLVGIL
ncbi:pyridoxal phosphate-dependent aminotransferase [Pseudodonghicola flavimaris]|uniref:Aminotransferase n=1 Tax=Pseudodonghicola flavimaris TaxID=3050036 RepID=A0ABT7F5B9_9RHOB|nr:pyridoxal phosphate-dependent aminotransferase [Pseudodonghicola flavimaris]MDK3019809.1 pyridoxal phosphate-dependent aminotransferase [Pseudodonghicola flavimaris]